MEGLRQQIATTRQSLFDEGILDGEFEQLEKRQTRNYPNFVEETVTEYLSESAKIIADIEQGMEETPRDFTKLDTALRILRSNTSRVGAIKVTNAVIETRGVVTEENTEGAKAALQQVKQELGTLSARLKPYFQLLNQARTQAST